MSAIRPSLKPSGGRVAIGLLALVAATGAALLPAASAAQPRARHLSFRVAAPSRQDVIGAHGIVLTARCPTEACTVVASARSTSPALRTGAARARVKAGGSARLLLPLGGKDGAKLEAALAAGRSPTFEVRATAKDAFGSRVPLSLLVRALKP